MSFSDEMATILEEQLGILKILEKLAHEKTDVIINNDVDGLEKLTKEEEGLINSIGVAEEKRLKLMDSWGVDINTLMSEIIEKSPDGTERLIGIKDDLVEILNSIRKRNGINSELIKDNLQWLDFNMNLISDVQTSTTYGKGKENKGINDSLFDRKV